MCDSEADCSDLLDFCTILSLLWRGHYIFVLFLSIFFFSSPNLSRRRLDVCYTSTHSANLECRSEMCCARLAGNAGPKNRQKVAIWAPSHKFVGLYLRN